MKYDLTKEEKQIFDKLNTPQKIQDFLICLPVNFEYGGETLMSPRNVLRKNKAHCIEAALFAGACLLYHGYKPMLLDLVANKKDLDHVVCLFRQNGHWGAISKANHNVLRWRDPVYKSVRELAMSYFHEYFMDDRRKSLSSYSAPFSLSKYDSSWIVADMDLWQIGSDLDSSRHFNIMTDDMKKSLRKVDRIEYKASCFYEWRGKKKVL